MKAVYASWKNGQISLDEDVDWPEGCRLLIEPVIRHEPIGMREEDWPTDPKGIAKHIALMKRFEPLEMTEQERAEWEAARQAQKEFEKANFNKWAEELEALFRDKPEA